MTVAQLIALLEKEDHDADVLVCFEGMRWPGYDISRVDAAEQEIGIATSKPGIHKVVVIS